MRSIIRLLLTVAAVHRDLVSSRIRWMLLFLAILVGISSGLMAPSLAASKLFKDQALFAFLIWSILDFVIGVMVVSSFTLVTMLLAAKLFPGLLKRVERNQFDGFLHLLCLYVATSLVGSCILSHHLANHSLTCAPCWIRCLSPKEIPGMLFWALLTCAGKGLVKTLAEIRKTKEKEDFVIKRDGDHEDHDDSPTPPPSGLAV